ncbi:TPA: response regulator transcription factor [Serratia marcescens]
MTHYTILIQDTNRYFAHGLKLLLHTYFTAKGQRVTFLAQEHYAIADLVILAGTMSLSMPQCHMRSEQRWLVVMDTQHSKRHQNFCIRVGAVITRHDIPKKFMSLVEMLLQPQESINRTAECPICISPLTYREYQVLSAIQQGLSSQQIGESLNLHVKTVSTYKCTAMRKLGFRHNHALYHWLLQGGLDTSGYAHVDFHPHSKEDMKLSG